MTLCRRVIGTILVNRDGAMVKGRGFLSDRVIGVPLQQARVQEARDIDELVLLAVDASEPNYELIAAVASMLSIPFSYGGGIRTTEQATRIIKLGADKLVFGSAAVTDPKLLDRVASIAGSQAVVVAIDVRQHTGCGKEVVYEQGKLRTELDPAGFARHVVGFGAGEILLQRVERDGAMAGYDLETLLEVREAIDVPVIASSGAGSYEHFAQALRTGADAVAAGALWAFEDATPLEAKRYLRNEFAMRLEEAA